MKIDEAIYRHAKQRAIERVNEEYTTKDIRKISLSIQTKKSIKLDISNMYRERHILLYQGKLIKVVYDCRLHSIVTFLPLTQIEKDIFIAKLNQKEKVYT